MEGKIEYRPKSFTEKIKDFFVGLGKGFVGFFVGFGKGVARFFTGIGPGFRAFGRRFKEGSVGTKLSHFFMGAGNFYHKQIIKGCIYLLIQLAYLAFMIFCPEVNSTPLGYKALVNFGTLGNDTFGANSMLMLLFGVATLGVTGIFIAAYLSNLKSARKADLDTIAAGKATSFKQDIAELLDSRFHILMLTPAILGIILFTVLPLIFMMLIAFTSYDSQHLPPLETFQWVWFENFAKIFSGNGEIAMRFWPVLGWTFLWAILATFSNYFLGVLLAVAINKKGIKAKGLFRTIFVLTIAAPQFITLLAMRALLSEYGPLQTMLVNLNILSEPVALLSGNTNPWTARITILLVNLWIGIPYSMLMTTGILLNVPTELYEAAKVDGAKPTKIFFKITLPYVIFVTTPYLISSFIGNILSFNIIYLLSGGGPPVAGYKAGGTDLLVTWLYKLTIDNFDYNVGAVIGILTFIVTSIITLITYRRTKSYKEEDTFQ